MKAATDMTPVEFLEFAAFDPIVAKKRRRDAITGSVVAVRFATALWAHAREPAPPGVATPRRAS